MALNVKICGITTPEDAQMAVAAGADALGLNFCAGTPRCISAHTARKIVATCGSRVAFWGLFVNEDAGKVREIAESVRLDKVQLHGEESPQMVEELADLGVVKAVRVQGPESLCGLAAFSAWGILLDGYDSGARGGTGKTFDWSLVPQDLGGARLILAGGLTPENVADAVRQVRPDWVDTSSGVEAEPGRKDSVKVRAFIERARGAKA